jgi:hypothetical protein
MMAAGITITPEHTPVTKMTLNACLTQYTLHSKLPGHRHMRLLHTHHIQVQLLPNHSKRRKLAFHTPDIVAGQA